VTLRDPEAMSMDSTGRIWLADLGDNYLQRSDGALYAFNEPENPDDQTVEAVRYPVSYSDGHPHDVETLLINPATNAKFVVTKTKGTKAQVFALPASLNPDVSN